MVKLLKKNNKKKNIILSSSKIKIALKILNNPKFNTLFIIKKNKELLGTITDGDLRRGFLKGFGLNDPVDLVMKRKFKFVTKNQIKDRDSIKKIFFKNLIYQIPVIDKQRKILDILYSETYKTNHTVQKNDFIIMAGGFGKRLKPLTNRVPKVMIKVFDKPMIKHIIDSAISDGFRNFFISVNYLKDKIENYLGDGSKFGIKINYIREKKPLGTAGSLSLQKSTNNLPAIVVNGDAFTDVNYNNLIKYHNKIKSQFTIVTSLQRDKEESGVLITKSNKVTDLKEKPIVIKKINAGIYVINKSILKLIKKNRHLNMTDFIKFLIRKKKRVVSFPIYEKWQDLGTKSSLSQLLKTSD